MLEHREDRLSLFSYSYLFMKWSIFTYHVQTKEGVIVYNTLNKGVIFLEKDKYDSLFSDDKNTHLVKKLKKQEFLIDDNFDEKARFMNALLKEWNYSNFLGLHILTTTGCNFKCPYCYQSGIQPDNLTQAKMDKAIHFIEEYIQNNGIKECRVEITGGEPTTNWKIVEKLLPNLKYIFKKYHVKY